MKQLKHHFDDISLLVTHYNRSSSLLRLLNRFEELNCSFHEIVVSDDCSTEDHINRITQSHHRTKLIQSPVNRGLGNNINKGQHSVTSPLTLYIQEDFNPRPHFVDKLIIAHEFMVSEPSLDMVRFYAYTLYPYRKPVKAGFSRMNFNLWKSGYMKFHYYSDHPHLRRSNFPEKFGLYREGIKSDKTEYKMMMSFLQQKGQGVFYDDHLGLFDHDNPEDEPSTVRRMDWRYSTNPLITVIRNIYRTLKFNFDYLFVDHKTSSN